MTDDRTAAREARLREAVQAAHHTIPAPLPAGEISARLRAGRERLGLNQTELATRAGVSLYHIVPQIEAGNEQRRDPLGLVALALALGEDWDWLGARVPPTIVPGSGRALATARIARGWTLAELSTRSEYALTTLNKLEHSTMNGSRRTWKGLAAVLGVAVTDLAPHLDNE